MKTYGRRMGTPVLLKTIDLDLPIDFSDDNSISGTDIDENHITEPSDRHISLDSIELDDSGNNDIINSQLSRQSSEISSQLNNKDIKTNNSFPQYSSDTIKNKRLNQQDMEEFEFLDLPKRSLKKRKKTNYKKKIVKELNDIDTEESTQELQSRDNSSSEVFEGVKNVGRYLSTLKPDGFGLLHVEEESDHPDNTTNNINKYMQPFASSKARLYGHSRTILVDNREDDHESDKDGTEIKNYEDEELYKEENGTADTSMSSFKMEYIKTFHYSELKNMGDTLKYQDELEFLSLDTNDMSLKENFVINKFVNLALLLNSEVDFFAYVQKYKATDIWEWCFPKNRIFSDPVLILLQGFFASTLFNENFGATPSYFSNFLIKLQKQVRIPKLQSDLSKMACLNFQDFLNFTNNKLGIDYSFEIFSKYKRDILIDNSQAVLSSCIDYISRIVDIEELSNLEAIFQVLNILLENDIKNMEITNVEKLKIIDFLMKLMNTEYINTMDFNKCLILLTNDEELIIENSTRNEIVNHCFKYFIASIDIINDATRNTSEDYKLLPLLDINVLILKLGLCLNVVSSSQISLDIHCESSWSDLTILMHSISTTNPSKSDNLEPQVEFIYNMILLNVAYLYIKQNNDEHLKKKDLNLIVVSLKKFYEDTNDYNESIHLKIKKL
ncbi:hypothetical protein TBLA_0G02940 [Henningerozyma blattae CBS 6284]|uniref:Rad61 Wapl domain-containing protein n=1 Tax=Henningerozyma blattae (strain ATCC 34711 / CBS 6284 / DSM 70876 / NBRC 10599 / NRRL Y-10934 / UCD 77-7) TaxID=1071380 RepID=I2H779_HENB6|nr:hypothetical protein TBLA_0G02940 [Tetrapisispora blattae CBS 6284]CCH62231.1 hypothetical protein TBLA_0G02940 [Tetrapisispora blattae CBS 6284]